MVYEKSSNSEWYTGTANAIYQNLEYMEYYNPEYVLILGGDHIYKMDYEVMLDYHKEKGAEVTLAAMPVPIEEAKRFGVLITDDIAEYSNSSGFYLQISEDYLCLVREVIHYIDPPETAGEYTLSGCGIDHEHLFFSERISLCPDSNVGDEWCEIVFQCNFLTTAGQGKYIHSLFVGDT